MAETPVRRAPAATRLVVARTEQLTPHMLRVVLGGDQFDRFADNGFTDRYVKLVFPRPGVDYGTPLDFAEIRRTLPPEQWPRVRTYTVRRYDPDRRELAIDFVLHGDAGVAGPWAAAARPGDELTLLGPGGAYTPRADVDGHLLVGDEAALPAIASALEAMPAGVPVRVLVEVDGPEEQQPLPSQGDVSLTWLYRAAPGHRVGAGSARRRSPEDTASFDLSRRPAGEDSRELSAPPLNFVEAVRALDLPDGIVQAFVHGEIAAMRDLRTHFVDERGIPADLLSLSGYWRRGKDEDGFQAEKAEDARHTRDSAQPAATT